MKLSKLEELVLNNTSIVNVNRAYKILSAKKFNEFNIHKKDKYYNIYGNFKSENRLQSYNAHLKIDLVNENVVLGTCNCNAYKEGVKGNKFYKCEHIIAAGLKFVEEIKKRINKNNTSKESLEKKIINNIINSKAFSEYNDRYESRKKLEVNVSLKEVSEEKDLCFDIYFFVGNEKMYPILNLTEFLEKIINEEEYYIGNGLIYNKYLNTFSEQDINLIKFLYNYVLISKNKSNKNSIRIPNIILDKLLNNISHKKVKFTYRYQNYISEVKKEDLPLTFTIKRVNENYVITTKKVFPIPLNKNMNIFFYDRNLYIPSSNQIELYKVFYYELKNTGKIELKSEFIKKDFNKIIWALSTIAQNIYYDENVIKEVSSNIKVNFDFIKDEEKYICNVSLYSQFGKISYKDALNKNNEIICPSKKLRVIERELNNCRFYFRNDRFEFLGEEEEFFEFIKFKFKVLQSIGEIQYYDDSYNLYYGEFKNIKISKNQDNKYNFSFDLNGIEKNQIEDVFNGYKNGESYFKLRNGRFIDLTNEELIKIMRILDNLNLNIENYKDNYEIGINQLMYFNERLETENLYNENKEKLKSAINKLKENKSTFKFDVPKDLNGDLRTYQKEGFNWFMNLKNLGLGGILCDEMGLGKTIQTIAFLLTQKEKTSLIIAPTSLIYNWNEEIEKFAPSLKVGIIHGSNKDKEEILKNIEEYNIILTTYGTVRNSFELYNNIIFENIVLDEGQNINNHKSQISNIVKNINSKNRFILTGTPIENNLNELWSLFDFIMPGYLFSNKEFNDRFIKNTTLKEKNLQELKILINPYILRRTKSEVIDELPDKIEKICIVENTRDQQRIYDGLINEIKENVESNSYNSAQLFSYLTKLRQICIDPAIVLDDYDGGSGKIEFVKKMVNDKSKEHKILIFSQFTSGLKKVEKMLNEEKIKYFYIDGSVNAKSRLNMVNEFNANKSVRIFLISLKAGGTGLNLTSADMVIHLDPWWNPAVEEQANDRAHRIGQQKEVEVIKLVAKGTIEEKIISLQEDKKNLINSVLTSELKESNVLDKLSSDELLKILVD